ncbi:hypothetical protein GGI04_000044 [Coemansia thaxteri]|uniref:Uncharacterized protein n=1 Tax=Coemansia thaxteri TaxID=2663907 RepID=A0A9W8BHD8_9FUNG|nr:hypothetical protein H4R26_000955 [Coemansia thaxteri]KAJ2009945.1 hypothetical protein GGI04_000044 [Coemansia thaxteri]KAJ2473509.1 hypothetical protein GGI02_000796 [Coemansia sp. RSA 2322]KAJ2484040.1 hypothetical protein EV174_002758 [Coemansia sp. RSA 2320]
MNRGHPLVVLDDYFVRGDPSKLLLKASRHDDDNDNGFTSATDSGYFEFDSGCPYLKELLSAHSIFPERWVRTDDVRIAYSSWLYRVHLLIIAIVAVKYAAGLTAGPAVYTLGTLSNICLFLVLSYHVVFFVALNYQPRWFEWTVIFYSPFAWAGIWLLLVQGDSHETASAAGSLSFSAGPLRAFLDQRVGPLALFLMHMFIWYKRRTVIGIAVFERKIRASSLTYWSHRAYSMLAALGIALVWKWYPCLSVCWDLYRYSATRDLINCRLVRLWAAERTMITWPRMVVTMLASGGTHVGWYSFISYAYHMVVWKEYLREGLAVWVIGNNAMCTKLT